MLEIDVVLEETYDETTAQFTKSASHRVCLEHSLASMSKWESHWCIPFLGKEEKTPEQTLSYIKMMILGDEPPSDVFHKLLSEHSKEIMDYIGSKMTATKISEAKSDAGYRETVTAELIHFWMVSMQVPFEAQFWHLNRLITLLRVISVKNSPKKKMSNAERTALNRKRKNQYNTRG